MKKTIEEIKNIIDQLQGLHLNSLTVELKAVIKNASKNPLNIAPICRKLKAFVNAIELLIASNRITKEQGQPLIDCANHIREKLGCFQCEK